MYEVSLEEFHNFNNDSRAVRYRNVDCYNKSTSAVTSSKV